MKFIEIKKIIIKSNIYERNEQKNNNNKKKTTTKKPKKNNNKKTPKKQQQKQQQKRLCYTMTSNIRLTSVDNDAEMDLMLNRLYFLIIDTCIMYVYPLTSVKHIFVYPYHPTTYFLKTSSIIMVCLTLCYLIYSAFKTQLHGFLTKCGDQNYPSINLLKNYIGYQLDS